MRAGTAQRKHDHPMRQGMSMLPELAPVDSPLSRRSTVMSALLRFCGVIHVYQSDSPSKPPAPSVLGSSSNLEFQKGSGGMIP